MSDPIECKGDMNFLELLNRLRFGVCSVPEDEKLVLTVGNKELDAFKITEMDVQLLEQQLEVAATEDVNLQKEKCTKAFHLNFDINKILSDMKVPGYSKPSKLNLYKKGFSIANHCDASGPGLLGTLIVILPTEYSGGNMCFEGIDVDIYESKQEETQPPKRCKLTANSFRYIFFETGLKHTISEVTSGYCIFLIYNIFDNAKSTGVCNPVAELSPIPKEWFDKLVEYAVNFCTGKKNILLGCFKYRNDVYHELVTALEKKFKVIDVAIEDVDDSDVNMEMVKEVHVIYPDDVENDGDCAPSFVKCAYETYQVEHVLLPSYCKLYRDHVDFSLCFTGRVQGSVEVKDELSYLAGSLINPTQD